MLELLSFQRDDGKTQNIDGTLIQTAEMTKMKSNGKKTKLF